MKLKLTDRQKKVIDIVQWVCIIFLLVVCVLGTFLKPSNNDFVKGAEYKKEQAYVKIYESQSIESLKKENKALYDSIRKLKDVESAVVIKYRYKVRTDTVRVKEFVHDAADSIYHYAAGNDTVSYRVDIKAKELEWVDGEVSINDRFMVINREKDGLNQTVVTHGPNVEVDGMDTWHRVEDKQKWYKRLRIGPQVGIGYGLGSGQVDAYVGVGITFTFN